MAVSAEDLIAPKGPVEPALFPGETSGDDQSVLLIRLNTYVLEATAKVTAAGFEAGYVDDATKAWALYLAFKAAHTIALARPAEEDAQMALLGRNRYDPDQRDAILDMANEWLAVYRALEATLSPNTASTTGIPSYQTRNVYNW